MDLDLYLRVIWRFRFLVLVGLVLAILLAGLAMFRVSFDGATPKFSYRQHEVYSASGTLQVTQSGFPEGRALFHYGISKVGNQQTVISAFADPQRFAELTVFYAEIAESDAVRALMYKSSGVQGSMSASPVTVGTGSKAAVVPLLQIFGSDTSSSGARATAEAGTKAFEKYLNDRQVAANIPIADRVVVHVVNEPGNGSLVTGRKKTIPIVVFMTVMIAAFGLAFILENLQPLVRPLDSTLAGRASESSSTARSA
jgi:hypothetical protein